MPIPNLAELVAERFPKLRALVLNRTDTAALEPLRNLSLEQLWLNDCPLRDLSPLAETPHSTTLNPQGCTRLETLEPLLATMPNLEHVNIAHGASGVDLSPLKELRGVRIILDPERIEESEPLPNSTVGWA